MPETQGGVQVIARVGQVLRALDGQNEGLSLAISVPVPAQRYWDLEDKLTWVRQEALAARRPADTDA